jgi:hypothetical protein
VNRHPAFNRKQARLEADPHPHDITAEERARILDCLARGVNARGRDVRKMLRLCDERLARIRELEARRPHAEPPSLLSSHGCAFCYPGNCSCAERPR